MLKWIWSQGEVVQIPERQYTEKAGNLFWDENIFRDLNYCVYRDNTRTVEKISKTFLQKEIFFQESSEKSIFWIT